MSVCVSIYSLSLAPFLRDSESHVPHTFTRPPSYDSDVPSTQSSHAVSRILFAEVSRFSRHVGKLVFFLGGGVAPCSLVD